jgi:hypothetical protein
LFVGLFNDAAALLYTGYIRLKDKLHDYEWCVKYVDWLRQFKATCCHFPGRERGKVKGKVVSTLFLTKHHAMKAYWGEWTYSSMHSLTSALDGGEWSVSRPGRFTHRKRAPGTHWIGGWLGPRASLETVMKRKIPSSRRESNRRTPIVQLVDQPYTDWAITALGVREWIRKHTNIIITASSSNIQIQ